jgi:hypothetical protein
LAAGRPSALLYSAVYRVSATPSGERPGYEEWYFLAATAAADVSSRILEDTVRGRDPTAVERWRLGARYTLVFGDPVDAIQSRVLWLTCQLSLSFDAIIAEFFEHVGPEVTAWHSECPSARVPRFGLVTSPWRRLAIPETWQYQAVNRICIWPRPVTERSYFTGV